MTSKYRPRGSLSTGNSCIPWWQINRLAHRIGCEQCGRDVTETIDGHECCGGLTCRRSLRVVAESERLAAELTGSRH